jgi:hypothetical protein
MNKFIISALSALLVLPLSITAKAGEKATYVGEGRYSCSTDSIDCAVLRQRNNELTERQYDRQENERRSGDAERREREYDRERQQDYESDY